jgi:hypothetical protein
VLNHFGATAGKRLTFETATVPGTEIALGKTDAAIRNSTNASDLRIAFITDPWGTEIALTEGLATTPRR